LYSICPFLSLPDPDISLKDLPVCLSRAQRLWLFEDSTNWFPMNSFSLLVAY
jgi:hypothetical protein